MGRPKKKLTDNSVKVRYKTLADGRKSVYLDCCDGGRRTYDFLKLYLLPETDREAVRRNKATMKKVEELQRERTLQLLGIGNGGTGDKPVFHTDMPLSEWMDAYIGEQKRYGVKNTAIITKVARILGTIAPDVRMSQVDKDFCLMFIDYLRNDYRARSGQPINRTTAWGYQCKLRAALNSAVRAGVLDPATLPKGCTAVLGETKSQRITTMIHSILLHSDGDVAVGSEEEEAFLALKDFMYANVYTDRTAKREEQKVEKVLTELYEYYLTHVDQMSNFYLQLAYQEGRDRAVTDYISGMSDEFAIRTFEDVFVPRKWHVL